MKTIITILCLSTLGLFAQTNPPASFTNSVAVVSNKVPYTVTLPNPLDGLIEKATVLSENEEGRNIKFTTGEHFIKWGNEKKAPQSSVSSSGNYSNQTVYIPNSSSSSSGDRVQVKGYYRKDGTYVQPHTRKK